MKLKYNEKWVGGLSDCCESPVKEVGAGLTILICRECGGMCNVNPDDDDEFSDDFFDD